MNKKNTDEAQEELTQKTNFADLGLSADILSALELKGYKTPSPIQAQVIPLLLRGDKDIIGQAQTGTGKTAAFALPLLEMVDPSKKEIQAIIMAPTRELAIQVSQEIKSFALKNKASVQVIYGGNPMQAEIRGIKSKPAIIVGTPGRIQHHIRTKTLKLGTIKYFVLDEADEMLNFGFREEIESILALTSKDRRILLFSATMSKQILEIAKTHMGSYDSVKIGSKEMTNTNISQKYYCLDRRDKIEVLSRIMSSEENFYAIVFCRTKANTDTVASQLRERHLQVEAIHGDIDQKNRQKILARFKKGATKILVATDVAARGIDVAELNFVINFSLPESYEIYTHRIGRTGRAGNKGTAVTFVAPDEVGKLRFFEKNLKVKLEQGILPSPKEIIENKKIKLIDQIEHLINNEALDDVQPIAASLLEEGNAQDIIAALLKKFYDKDFSVKNYDSIVQSKPRSGGGGGGRSRSSSRGRSSFSRGGGSRSRRSSSSHYGTPKKGSGNSKGLKSGKRGKDAYKKK